MQYNQRALEISMGPTKAMQKKAGPANAVFWLLRQFFVVVVVFGGFFGQKLGC